MSRKPDRRIKKTKASLHQAFYELLKKKNYSDITVKELAEEADITRKTFYLHYNTLDDLLREFMAERYERLQKPMEDMDLFSEDFDYFAFFTHLYDLFLENHDLIKKLMDDQNSRYVMQRVMDENENLNFERTKVHFDLRPEILRIYFRYYTRGISGTFLEWFTNPDAIPLEEFVDTVRNINLQMRDALLKYRI
ncbi:MAG: TetR/AcrR family transcriptional regulator [Lachnospiraceae bacterium]|nr:TetR/AcrR family transcriptional regulator [Lachnospiraceae bacterium]